MREIAERPRQLGRAFVALFAGSSEFSDDRVNAAAAAEILAGTIIGIRQALKVRV